MGKGKPAPTVDEGIDDLLDDLEEDLTEDTSTPSAKGKGAKSAPAAAGSKKDAPKKEEKKGAKPTTDKKEAGEKKLEGLTKETVESGVITFKKGSGSAHLLQLIRKFGFDRAKVLAAATKLKEAGKGFINCDPAKKYGKVAGIIKNLQNANYKLNA